MPNSPFDDNFDGRIGDVTEGQETPKQAPLPVPPVAKAKQSSVPPVRTGPVTPKAVAPEPEPATAIGFDPSDLKMLLQYLIAKEGREAQAAVDHEIRRKSIQSQRERNAKDQDSKRLLKQAKCKHLKGGKRGPKTQNKDYAVYQHQFISFARTIKCRICGAVWMPEDTVEYLVRVDKRGIKRKISNHTHKGWREALEMVEGSTDTASASEAVPNIAPNATYVDAAGLPVQHQIVDRETGEMVEGVTI